MNQEKTCSKCKITYSITMFSKDSTKSDGLHSWCNLCRRAINKLYYINNKQTRKISQKDWVIKNREKVNKIAKRWRTNNPSKVIRNRKKYNNANKLKIQNDSTLKWIGNQRLRIRQVLKRQNIIKSHRTLKYIGCTTAQFQQHIKNQCTSDMTLENYGKPNGWVIDHRIPISFFDITDPAEQIQAFHYTNCQPMYTIENLKKGDSILPTHASFLLPYFNT